MGRRWRIASTPDPDPDDTDLVAAAAAGDQIAQRKLFDREYPRVFATVSRWLGSDREVDDLVQETFITVFQTLPSFRGEAKLATWINRIAVNVVFMYLRTRKRVPMLVSVDTPSPAAGRLVEQADAREGLRRLYAALEDMTPVARAAFALYAIDGRSISEIAELMGTRRVTAKLRIWRARREIEQRADLDPVLAEFLEAHRQK